MSNKNENATVQKSKKFSELNKTLNKTLEQASASATGHLLSRQILFTHRGGEDSGLEPRRRHRATQ